MLALDSILVRLYLMWVCGVKTHIWCQNSQLSLIAENPNHISLYGENDKIQDFCLKDDRVSYKLN